MVTDAEGAPVEFAERTHAASLPLRYRRVVEVLESWRIDDEWWRTPLHRRYVDVVLEGGGHVVVFEDLSTGAWYVQQP
jgi:hypothetical protein